MLKNITQSDWYQESVRFSGLSGQKFALNAIVSLSLLVTLVICACVAN